MDKEPLIRLVWHGEGTIKAVSRLLTVAEQIELTLPSDYNHALFHALNPDAQPGEPEYFDISAGPELLAQAARVRGLEALATLAELLGSAQTSVRVFSPPTLMISLAPDRSARE